MQLLNQKNKRRSYQKMSNSHNLIKSVALAGVLTATGTLATTVAHADTVNPVNTENPTINSNDSQKQLTNLKNQQTQAENQLANANQKEMANATYVANQQINDINNQIKQQQAQDVATQQATLSSAQQQINTAAQNATNAENTAYAKAVANQQAANDTALKSAQANIVTPAQKAQQIAQENANYRNQTGNLSTAHNQNLNKIDADYQNQTKQVNQEIANHDQAVKSATTNVDNQINAASDAVNTAQKTVNNAQADLDDFQTTVSTSNTDIPTSTKGFIDHYNAQKFELPKAYVNSLHNVHDIASSNQFEQTINPDMKMFKMFDYQSDPDAAKEKVDVLHLTGQQILQLNLYSTRLINQIRAQFGMPAFKLNPQAIANAQRMANQESAGKMSGHHLDILKGAGENVGSFSGQITQDSTQKQMSLYKASGEHPDVWVKRGPNDTRLIFCWVDLSFKTMDDLQAGLFYTVTAMMFADAGQEACGHALNFSLWNESPDSQMALGIESFANDNDPKEGSVYYRWIFTNSRQVNPKNNLDTTPTNAHGANIAQDHSVQIKSAQAALTNAKQALTNAQNKLNTLKTNRDQMIQDLVTKAGTDDSAVKKFQAQLTKLKNDHDSAIQKENNAYQNQLNGLKTVHEQKLAKITATSSNLNNLKAQLQKKLDVLKTNHEAKLNQIKADTKKKLDNLKLPAISNTEVTKLQNKIADIKKNLANKKTALDNKLSALKAKNKAKYEALAAKLNNSSKETAKGNSNHYTTQDGHETVILPDKDNKPSNPITVSDTTKPTSSVTNSQDVKPSALTVTNNTPKPTSSVTDSQTVKTTTSTATSDTPKPTSSVTNSQDVVKPSALTVTNDTPKPTSSVTDSQAVKTTTLTVTSDTTKTTSSTNNSQTVKPSTLVTTSDTAKPALNANDKQAVKTTTNTTSLRTPENTIQLEFPTESESKKKLPQTGNKQNFALVTLGAIGASIAMNFGFSIKRRHN